MTAETNDKSWARSIAAEQGVSSKNVPKPGEKTMTLHVRNYTLTCLHPNP